LPARGYRVGAKLHGLAVNGNRVAPERYRPVTKGYKWAAKLYRFVVKLDRFAGKLELAEPNGEGFGAEL
jgi:hypothetical protein